MKLAAVVLLPPYTTAVLPTTSPLSLTPNSFVYTPVITLPPSTVRGLMGRGP